ncbi:MAG TPA: hypothetical protein VII75_15030 [Thermoanaerobaculia bacterium]|nr:hypothetical protein [Thermoanaerobaculia bacterium]
MWASLVQFEVSVRHILLILLLAVPMFADQDDRIAAQLHAHGTHVDEPHVVLWYGRGDLSAGTAREFAQRLSSGVEEIETVVGTKYNQKIECFVSPDVEMSHAYSGKKPYFYVSPERVNGREVPYRHELTHIIAWWSCDKALWLQEGFADYVSTEARRRFPHQPEYDTNVFNPENEDIDVVARHVANGRAAVRVIPLIAVDAMPPSLKHWRAFYAIFNDREITAPVFYNLSHSFTRYAIKRLGMAKVEAACKTENPSATLAKDAGVTMEKLREEWLASLH